jgi:anti-anti-sigma regulatory factor
MLRVDGSLFFGAVEHVRDAIDAARSHSPNRRHLLLVGSGINFIDVAGAELLVQEAKLTRDAGASSIVQSETGRAGMVLNAAASSISSDRKPGIRATRRGGNSRDRCAPCVDQRCRTQSMK